jgi:UDP-2,4-diacetamido-2,4,6-trideoxy-beta-L-altropyranose hydrolase
MNVVIRTDASMLIGSGHVTRCLTLADQLRAADSEVSFVCRDLPGALLSVIERSGYPVSLLQAAQSPVAPVEASTDDWLGVDWQTDAAQTIGTICQKDEFVDWLIVDQYALDARWEMRLKPHVGSIMVIDDLANRRHECDVILDQNFFGEGSSRYKGLVPAKCVRLLGPRYALLRQEFVLARLRQRRRAGEIRRILIFFGGVDRTNETSKAIEAVMFAAEQGIAIDVIIGASNPYASDIEAMTAVLPTGRLRRQVDNMAELMTQADLAIGAGGTTTWERAYLGLPSITVVVAENQAESTRSLDEAGAVWNLGNCTQVGVDDIRRAVRFAMLNPHTVNLAGQRAQQIFGDYEYGGTEEVVRTIKELTHVTA